MSQMFAKGDRVKLSAKAIEMSIRRLDTNRVGAVVGFGRTRYSEDVVYVIWDGNKSRQPIHSSFLEKT